MKKVLSGVLILVLMLFQGCVWVDDDDDCCPAYPNEQEHIIYVNLTNNYVENYIDEDFKGTVSPDSELHVYGYDYDGTHWFHSVCVDCEKEWGPDEFTIDDGETFTIYLENDGRTSTRHAK